MTADLLEQGLELMLIGMGTVFVFLILLVAAMNLMSWLVAQLPAAAPAPGVAAQDVAAIAAAIRMHRKNNRTP
jgi:oxaloacetate decarboxylase (Na+ extruding) subunit gamma